MGYRQGTYCLVRLFLSHRNDWAEMRNDVQGDIDL
jgi:hypothetical protein